MTGSDGLKIGLDLREASVASSTHHRLLNLAAALDALESEASFELITNETYGIIRRKWSGRTKIVPPSRLRWLHNTFLGRLRPLIWGDSKVMHFLTGDVWHLPTCATVVTFHDLAPLHYPEFFFETHAAETAYERHMAKVFEVADRVIAVSDFVMGDLLERYPEAKGKIRRVYHAIDPLFQPEEWGVEDRARFRSNLGLNRGFLLYNGGMDGRKNLPFLLDVYRAYLKKEPASPRRLAIAGDPHQVCPGTKPLPDLISERNLQGQVILLGWCSDELMKRVYSSTSLFLFPSKMEGFGYEPLEAMACGCPVLCSDQAALAETAGDAARLLPTEDPDRWADSILELHENIALRTELIKAGFEQVKKYSWEQTARELLDVYREL
jgi:alpha-1,3-rhamnosyl/mannosyltransferase